VLTNVEELAAFTERGGCGPGDSNGRGTGGHGTGVCFGVVGGYFWKCNVFPSMDQYEQFKNVA
jgi:hypothetical protein